MGLVSPGQLALASNSDIISINSDFFNADDIEVEGWKKEGGAEIKRMRKERKKKMKDK